MCELDDFFFGSNIILLNKVVEYRVSESGQTEFTQSSYNFNAILDCVRLDSDIITVGI